MPQPNDTPIRIRTDQRRELVGDVIGQRNAALTVILYENSTLEVSQNSPALNLIYTGAANGSVSLSTTPGATVWIESWDCKGHEATLRVDIPPGANVGLSKSVMASVQHDGIHVTFNSEGTGCLAATWDTTRTSPALRVSGMSAGDRLNVSVVDKTGSTFSLDRFFALSDAPSSVRTSLLTTWLPDVDPSLFEWVEDSSVDTHLPRGVECANLQTLAPLAINDAAAESESATRPPERSTVTYHRAAITAEQWKRCAPIVFEANALKKGIPLERVVLAPGQSVRYGGHTVAAHQLINGQSIIRDETGHCVTYTVAAAPDECISVAAIELINTEALVEPPSASVEQCRQRLLAEVAAQNQMMLVDRPALRLDIGGLIVEGTAPINTTGIWRFTLPDVIPPGDLRIVSRSAVARETSVLPIQDDRVLGVALSAVSVISGQTLAKVDLSHPSWVGLHPWEYRRGTRLRWTNGLASIPQDVHKLFGSETIELSIAAVGRYWVPNDLFADDSEAST